MSINTSTFASDTLIFLRNYIKENVTDPLSRTDGFVMTAYPKKSVQYPIVTIKITNLNSEKLGIGSDTNLVKANIEVRTWARNSKESDNLTEQVINALRSAQYATEGTSNNQIFGFKLNSTNSIVETTEGDNVIHSKVMSYTYQVII